jgi:hypothetical protein
VATRDAAGLDGRRRSAVEILVGAISPAHSFAKPEFSSRASILRVQLLQILLLQRVLQNSVPNRLGLIG